MKVLIISQRISRWVISVSDTLPNNIKIDD